MPQNQAYENHNLWVKTAKRASHSCYKGVANLIQFTAERLGKGRGEVNECRNVVRLALPTFFSWITHINDKHDCLYLGHRIRAEIRDTCAGRPNKPQSTLYPGKTNSWCTPRTSISYSSSTTGGRA